MTLAMHVLKCFVFLFSLTNIYKYFLIENRYYRSDRGGIYVVQGAQQKVKKFDRDFLGKFRDFLLISIQTSVRIIEMWKSKII